jgi:hypothetical protein
LAKNTKRSMASSIVALAGSFATAASTFVLAELAALDPRLVAALGIA